MPLARKRKAAAAGLPHVDVLSADMSSPPPPPATVVTATAGPPDATPPPWTACTQCPRTLHVQLPSVGAVCVPECAGRLKDDSVPCLELAAAFPDDPEVAFREGCIKHFLGVHTLWDWIAWLRGHATAVQFAARTPAAMAYQSIGRPDGVRAEVWQERLSRPPERHSQARAVALVVRHNVCAARTPGAPSWHKAASMWSAALASVTDVLTACAALADAWFTNAAHDSDDRGATNGVNNRGRQELTALVDAAVDVVSPWVVDGAARDAAVPPHDVGALAVDCRQAAPLRPPHIALLAWVCMLQRATWWAQRRAPLRGVSGNERVRALWRGLLQRAWRCGLLAATAAADASAQRWAEMALLLAAWAGPPWQHDARTVVPAVTVEQARVVARCVRTAPALLHVGLVLSPTADAVWHQAAAACAAVMVASEPPPTSAPSYTTPLAAAARAAAVGWQPPASAAPAIGGWTVERVLQRVSRLSGGVAPSAWTAAASTQPPAVTWSKAIGGGTFAWQRAAAVAAHVCRQWQADPAALQTLLLPSAAAATPLDVATNVIALANVSDTCARKEAHQLASDVPTLRQALVVALHHELADTLLRGTAAETLHMMTTTTGGEDALTYSSAERAASHDTRHCVLALAHAWLPFDIVLDALAASSHTVPPFCGNEEAAAALPLCSSSTSPNLSWTSPPRLLSAAAASSSRCTSTASTLPSPTLQQHEEEETRRLPRPTFHRCRSASCDDAACNQRTALRASLLVHAALGGAPPWETSLEDALAADGTPRADSPTLRQWEALLRTWRAPEDSEDDHHAGVSSPAAHRNKPAAALPLEEAFCL